MYSTCMMPLSRCRPSAESPGAAVNLTWGVDAVASGNFGVLVADLMTAYRLYKSDDQ